jgi:3-methyladenine DNA glycosylase Mpg
MNEKFWQEDPKEVAQKLLGKTMVFKNTRGIILKAEGFRRKTNTGIYKPIAEMAPGGVYCPRVRNSIIILIATFDNGRPGGCVLIKAAKIKNEVYNGPGKVAEQMGIVEPRSTGQAKWIDKDTFAIHLDGQYQH